MAAKFLMGDGPVGKLTPSKEVTNIATMRPPVDVVLTMSQAMETSGAIARNNAANAVDKGRGGI